MSKSLFNHAGLLPLALLALIAFAGCAPVVSTDTKTPTTPGNTTASDTGVVLKPVFSPVQGTYTSAQSVTITSETGGAEIRYTTDGSQPSVSSTLYSSAITVSATVTLRAIAMKTDMMSSFEKADYTITGKVAKPVVLPATSTYSSPQEVTITCATSGAEIHYTLDGQYPQSTDPVYGGAFTVSSSATVSAVGMKPGWTSSDMAFSTIMVNIPSGTTVPPTFSPAGGLYYNDQTVTLSQTNSAPIYYTTDGSDPTTSSTPYAGSISVSTTATQIKAIAYDSGMTTPTSSIVSATYRLKVSTPTASPDPSAGAVNYNSSVTLSCATSGASITYDPNGGNFSTSSVAYIGPISLYSYALDAFATKTGYETSDVLVANYGLKTSMAYSDGNGHVYELVMNGNDIDISSMFEHVASSISFGVDGSISSAPVLYYSTGGRVYQFSKSGADTDVTSSFESFATDSVLFFAQIGSAVTVVYRAGSKLYQWNASGVDSDITPNHFSAGSEVVGLIYTDGANKVYVLATGSDTTSMLTYFDTGSHLLIVYGSSPYAYTAGSKLYAVTGSTPTPEFDASEFDYFTLQAKTVSIQELTQ
jgi:hypothetical protein